MRLPRSLLLVFVATVVPAAHGQTLPSVIRPSRDWRHDEAVSRRARYGVFHFDATVNGTALPMLFDTGASRVVLRAEDAARAGIDVAALDFSLTMSTANGKAKFAPVTVRTLTVGEITRSNVPAAVAEAGKLSSNLLGQSFLARLSGYRMDGDRLVLLGGQ